MHQNAQLKEHGSLMHLIFEYFLDKVQVYKTLAPIQQSQSLMYLMIQNIKSVRSSECFWTLDHHHFHATGTSRTSKSQ